MTFWGKDEDGWEYQIFDKDTPAVEFGGFSPFKSLWDSKRVGGNLPSWRSFELEDFSDWYGWVTVEDVIPGPTYDSRFRLWGTNIANLYGLDPTGKKMSEYSGAVFTPFEFDLGTKMVQEQLIAVSEGPMRVESRTFITFSSIELPLSNDGETVHNIIALIMKS
jgi:hypothetical protein